MNPTSSAIYEKLSELEGQLQRLKIQTYRALPQKSRVSSLSVDKAIYQAVRETRENIWQKRYAKKITRVH